jgi:hypothetical protein
MLLYFHVNEKPELFTVFDYKQLLTIVKKHFIDECELQLCEPYDVEVFFNPEENCGIIRYRLDTNIPIFIRKTEMNYSIDFITITFANG